MSRYVDWRKLSDDEARALAYIEANPGCTVREPQTRSLSRGRVRPMPEVTREEAQLVLDWYSRNGVPNGIEARLAKFALEILESDDA